MTIQTISIPSLTNVFIPTEKKSVNKKERQWTDVAEEITVMALPFLAMSEPLSFPASFALSILNVKRNIIKLKSGIEKRSVRNISNGVLKTGIAVSNVVSFYKPLSFAASIVSSSLKVGTPLIELTFAIKKGDVKQFSIQSLATAAAIIALAATILVHPVGELIDTASTLVIEITKLPDYVIRGEHLSALKSCTRIFSSLFFFAVLIHGGPQFMIAYLIAKTALGIFKANAEFRADRYFAACGGLLFSVVKNGKKIAKEVPVLLYSSYTAHG